MQTAFQARAIEIMHADARLEGLLLAGSGASGDSDRFSDLDLVVVVRDQEYDAVMATREAFAHGLGSVAACFTGEHVGEPRLLICLYAVPEGDGVLHVDLKFVRATDLAERVDEPTILFDRIGACARGLAQGQPFWPERDSQWFEDRVWIWLHYGAARLGRGERYEALAMVNWLREQVLAPMLSRRAGVPQRGLRRIETLGGETVAALESTVAGPNTPSLWAALMSSRALYLALREDAPPERRLTDAEARVSGYLEALSSGKARQ